jgi:sphingomyelin phosphodiesterase
MATVIYVQNNTPYNFDVSWVREGAPLAASKWKKGSSRVTFGRKAKVLEFNRDSGITNGKRFYFTTRLARSGSVLSLRQQLKGKMIGSTMWQALSGPGFSHAWQSDRKIRSATWNMPDGRVGVNYRAYFTGGDDDIEYVLHHTYRVEPSDEHTLNVLAYNIYMRPVFVNGQSHRTRLLPAEIRGYDVIVFSEAFDDGLRKKLLASLKGSYPYATKILGTDRGIEQDGGVIIVSKWPIKAQDQKRFGRVCHGSDCMSDKGVLYAKIDKKSRPYHIFGSHTQAAAGPKDRSVRKRQLEIIRNFIASKKIPKDEPVIIAGDLNVNKESVAEYNAMLRILNADHPSPGGAKYTFYPTINDLASGKNEFLDYVLWSKSHLAPTAARNQVRIPRAASGWKDLPTEKERWDLSDHYPVYGRLTFPKPTVKIKPPAKKTKATVSPKASGAAKAATAATAKKVILKKPVVAVAAPSKKVVLKKPVAPDAASAPRVVRRTTTVRVLRKKT